MKAGNSSSGRASGSRHHPYRRDTEKAIAPADEQLEHKLYVGNLDHRITEYHVIKLFAPHGTIKREEYLWHTHGPKKGEPRGYAFVEFSTRQEAEAAKKKLNGQTVLGRPLVVRFVEEKVVANNADPSFPASLEQARLATPQAAKASSVSKFAKIAAIQKKLWSMERERASEGAD